MIDTRAVMRSLPLVASILGRKYGVQVEMGGADAYTDGSVIHLPALPGDVPDTLLALARGYVDHEAAHIRDTDFLALKQAGLSPLETHVWNILEDFRVEHKLASIFPGCRQNFDWLIRHIFGSESSGAAAQPAMQILNWLLLEVRSWDVQALATNRNILAEQVDNIFPGLRLKVGRVLALVRTQCCSTSDAIEFAREIVRVLDQFANPSTPKTWTAQQFHDEGNSDSCSKEPGQERTKQEKASEINDFSSADDEQIGNPVEVYSRPSEHGLPLIERHRDSPDKIDDESRNQLQNLLGASAEDLPVDLGDILAEALQNSSRQSQDAAVTVAISTSKHTQRLSDADILEARQTSMALRTRLGGLLQTKLLTRNSSGRRGKLDTGQLHRLSVSDPRIFRGRSERIGIDTAVHILLDCSMSMVRRIRLASSSCYALASALESAKINVAVTAFPGLRSSDDSYSTVAPIIAHGQKVHAKLDLAPEGGTPMGEALWWVLQDMLPLSERRKLILVVTDGEPDSLACATQAIEHGRRAGFEIFGVGITSPGINALLPGRSVVVNSMAELSQGMFALIESSVFGN